MAQDDAKAVYDRFPCRARAGWSSTRRSRTSNPRAANKVNFRNDDRPPLLIIGNELDHTVPASVSKEAAKRLPDPACVGSPFSYH